MTPSQSRGQYHTCFQAVFLTSDIQPWKVISYHQLLLLSPLCMCNCGRGVTCREWLLLGTLRWRRHASRGKEGETETPRPQLKDTHAFKSTPSQTWICLGMELRHRHTQYETRSEAHQFTPDNSICSFQHNLFWECNYLSLSSIILIKYLSDATVLDVIQHFHLFSIFKGEHIMKRLIRASVLINQSAMFLLQS